MNPSLINPETFKVGDALTILAEIHDVMEVRIQPDDDETHDIVLKKSSTPGVFFSIDHKKTMDVMSLSSFGKMCKFRTVTSYLGVSKTQFVELSPQNIRDVFRTPSEGMTITFGQGNKIPFKGQTEQTFRRLVNP